MLTAADWLVWQPISSERVFKRVLVRVSASEVAALRGRADGQHDEAEGPEDQTQPLRPRERPRAAGRREVQPGTGGRRSERPWGGGVREPSGGSLPHI